MSGPARIRPDRERAATRYVVARARDIPDGERLIVDVAGRSVGVFNVSGNFYAVLNRCPHAGAELCKGDILGLVESDGPGCVTLDEDHLLIVCPWHGWEYDLRTGDSWFDPLRTRARRFDVGVERGEMLADRLREGEARQPDDGNARFVDPKTHRVRGPYTADILPVEVEDDYVVVSLARQRRSKED